MSTIKWLSHDNNYASWYHELTLLILKLKLGGETLTTYLLWSQLILQMKQIIGVIIALIA